MRIAIATDAWYPQPNGVVRVVSTVTDRLRDRGHEVMIISPDLFRTLPCPTYPDIRLSLFPASKVTRMLDDFKPDAIHLATEGPLGAAARRYCRRRSLPFTTAYHTKFPEYIHARAPFIPLDLLYRWVRGFHSLSSTVMVPSHSVYRELSARHFTNVKPWSHGVDTDVFKPGPKDRLDRLDRDLLQSVPQGLARPIFMFIGRVTVEKNIPGFLDLDLPGSKVVVGSGPAREDLMRKYPDVPFLIANGDQDLASYYNAADAFVFPSLTDTFGLVMLEAMACGVPVAAFPVTGPLDVIGTSKAGILDDDLAKAAVAALDIDPATCRDHALGFSWDRVADEFLEFLAPLDGSTGKSVPLGITHPDKDAPEPPARAVQ